jgi:hypothetical protein
MRHEATEGRSVAAPVQGGRAAGHGGAQRGCARTGGQGSRARRGAAWLRPYRGAGQQGTEGRSVAAPVQGGRAAGHGGAQRGCARTGGQGSRHGGAQRGCAHTGGRRGEGMRRGLRKASLMSHPQTRPENATVNAAAHATGEHRYSVLPARAVSARGGCQRGGADLHRLGDHHC